jgi:dephospho-CoA kinase
MKHTFAFCGPIGSGKSSVSKLFAMRVGAIWNSFGTTVREIALERRLPTNRESLQNLGALLVKDERSSFCSRVIGKTTSGSAGAGVIDGLRHIGVLDELRRDISPQQLVCIYVDAPRSVRLERVKQRDGLTEEQLSDLERHSTEIEVEHRLKKASDFIADNEVSVEQCVDSIVQWTQQRNLL